MANEVADTLDKARALIEKGWIQGAYAFEGCYCALGAIEAAAQAFTWRDVPLVLAPLELAVGRKAGIGNNEIAGWNDDPERTQAEVVQAFKEAAALARAGAL